MLKSDRVIIREGVSSTWYVDSTVRRLYGLMASQNANKHLFDGFCCYLLHNEITDSENYYLINSKDNIVACGDASDIAKYIFLRFAETDNCVSDVEESEDAIEVCSSDNLQYLNSKATPGPWLTIGGSIFSEEGVVCSTKSPLSSIDAKLICAMRNAFPDFFDLLKMNENTRANIKRLYGRE